MAKKKRVAKVEKRVRKHRARVCVSPLAKFDFEGQYFECCGMKTPGAKKARVVCKAIDPEKAARLREVYRERVRHLADARSRRSAAAAQRRARAQEGRARGQAEEQGFTIFGGLGGMRRRRRRSRR